MEGLTCPLLSTVPDHATFLHDYLLPNRPVLLPPSLIEQWDAVVEWQQQQAPSSSSASSSPSSSSSSSHATLHPAFDLLAERYGSHVVPVVVVQKRRRGGKEEKEGEKKEEEEEERREEMTLREAVELMHSAKRGSDTQGEGEMLVYVKDWHLILQERQRCGLEGDTRARFRRPYTTPDLFKDDWMNGSSILADAIEDQKRDASEEKGDAQPDDFRFCYAGMKGTTTGLHADVYGSYSWSTNIVGRKRWKLYHPDLYPLLRRREGRGPRLSASESKELERLLSDTADPRSTTTQVTIIQEQGQTLFVPSGMFHSVENLTDCISINHNWCNSVNLPDMYRWLKVGMDEVGEALSDVRESLQQQQQGQQGQQEHQQEQDQTANADDGGQPWQVEFYSLVGMVAQADSGWNWTSFFRTVLKHVRLLSHRGEYRRLVLKLDIDGETHPLCPDPNTLSLPRLRAIVDDFTGGDVIKTRDEGDVKGHDCYTFGGRELRGVIDELQRELG